MELSPEAMENLNKMMAQQIKESSKALSTQITAQLNEQLAQQMDQLNTRVDTTIKEMIHAGASTGEETSATPTPSEALRLHKGKGHIGSSAKRSRHTSTRPRPSQDVRNNAKPLPFDNAGARGSGAAALPPRYHRPSTTIGGQRVFYEDEDAYYDDQDLTDRSHGSTIRARDREPRRDVDPVRQQIKHLKIRFPSFIGSNDPELYLDWERKMESNFLIAGTYPANKVKIAISEFSDYALLWWEQLCLTRARANENPITTWAQLLIQMRKKFIPAHYHREILNKLRRLIQGSKSVREYYQELETLLIRAGLQEGEDMVMSRFLGGLNRDIQDKLELQTYVDIDEMIHKAELIEAQNKRRTNRSSFSPRDNNTMSKPVSSKDTKPSQSVTKEGVKSDIKPKSTTSLTGVRCFRCQ